MIISRPTFAWMNNTKFIARGARSKGRKAYFRKFGPAHNQWGMMKDMLNELVLEQRIEATLPKCKELQQYAEEIVFLAKKGTPYHDGLVESMLTSPSARHILYERMVPRYRDRAFHFTRIVNTWQYRIRDAAQIGLIEYVDRPGELRPAAPVGAARVQHVAYEFLATRRGRRRHLTELQEHLAKGRGAVALDSGVLERRPMGAQAAPRQPAHPRRPAPPPPPPSSSSRAGHPQSGLARPAGGRA
ncbi:unnamed protein product [Prorocentrum cordatum]|uniref:Uncharacterized protein n=2 Tax=Prorocentrum cordatum TaxID=2364126 RepID=A0ABN9WN95_9DINO|nr:unnamed protein product [Polarella glacialis]